MTAPCALHIDPLTGNVEFKGLSLLLERHMPVARVQTEFAALLERSWDHHNGYAWIALGGALRLAERPASLSLCFFEGRLTLLALGVSLPDDEEQEGWPTEQTSLRQVSFLRRALAKQLDTSLAEGSALFPWGSVWARFDPKGFMATAGIRYDPVAPTI